MRETGSHIFEDQWPDLARRLDAMLAGKRVPPHKRDDIVQETGLRLFRMWDQVDPARPLWALVVTIALNLLRDEARKHPEREVLGLVPDRAADQDVERAGLARLELRRVRDAMTQLSPAHRSILMAELGDDSPAFSRGANATKMLRMRARRRLNALLDVASASGVVFGLRIRRLFDFEQHIIAVRGLLGGSENFAAHAAAGVLSAVALFAAVGGPFSGEAGANALPRATKTLQLSAEAASAGDLTSDARTLVDRDSNAATRSRSTRSAQDMTVTPSPANAEPENKPYRAGTRDTFVEGAVEVGLMGFGARVGDRGGKTPACLAPGAEIMLPPGAICSKGETRDGVRAKFRVGYGSHSEEVEVEVD